MGRKNFVSDDDLIRELKGRHLVEPSRRILVEAIELGGQLAPASRGLAAWVAELLFDSGLAPATAGVRNGASASERRLLYRCRGETELTGEAQIDLRLRAVADGTVEIVGQVLPPWRGARVEAKAGRARRHTALGANGEFSLVGIPGGRDTLLLAIRAEGGSSLVLDRVPMPAREKRPPSR
jgi:hypothetical protein